MTRSAGAPKELRTLVEVGCTGDLTDGQLLERFQRRTASSEAAFETLVDRHAAMVWGVCRRSLDRADAEDAFQATFLVLVRRAGSIRTDDRDSAGRWLYGVARRVASRLRQEAARRPPAASDPAPAEDPASLAERRDACETVIAELDRLPTKYRRPIELCDFEGLTYEQAGVFLGWPTATLKNRLAQGRSRLRDRLTRRGLAPAALIALARESQAAVPKALVHSTCRAGAIASGTIPLAVSRLTEGAIRTMFLDRMKTVALFVSMGFGAAAASMAALPGEEAAPLEATIAPDAGKVARTPDPRFSQKMPNGATVEIVAVSTAPATGVWWSPDGTPLPKPPCDLIEPRQDAENGLYRILYQVSNAPEDDDTRPAPGAPTLGFQSQVRRDGKVVPGLKRCDLGYMTRRETGHVSFRSSYGPWETVRNWHPSASGGGGGSENNRIGRRRIYNHMAVGDGQSVATVVHEADPSESFLRITAFDQQGREIKCSMINFQDTNAFSLLQATFDQPLGHIREFRLESRPQGYVSIDGFALHPNRPSNPR